MEWRSRRFLEGPKKEERRPSPNPHPSIASSKLYRLLSSIIKETSALLSWSLTWSFIFQYTDNLEATSARMAARDRFSAYLEPPVQSTLQRYIRMSSLGLPTDAMPPEHEDSGWLSTLPDNACDPQNYEPNLALNLEVVDLINTKRGNAWVQPVPRLRPPGWICYFYVWTQS